MELNPYLILAYILLWGLIGVYLWFLGATQRRLQRRLETLEQKPQA